MPIIDEEGRLFGAINVVDALVVLLVIAVGIAGIALVTGGVDTGEPQTRYITLDFGSQPGYVAERITVGDEARYPDRSATLTITDTYFGPSGDETRAIARVRVQGEVTDGSFLIDGEPVPIGELVQFNTGNYLANGTVRDLGNESELPVQTRTVVLASEVDIYIADRMSEGDTYTVAGEPVATIESLAVYGTDDPDRKRIYAGLTVAGLMYQDSFRFGTSGQLREGATVPFRTDEYEFNGEIVSLQSLSEQGETEQRTVTLRMDNVPPERANSVKPGLTETTGGDTVARVQDVQVEPAVITLTSNDGNIYKREHPINKDVTLTVELQVRAYERGVRFKGRTLQEGNQIVLDLGTTTVRAVVVDLDAS